MKLSQLADVGAVSCLACFNDPEIVTNDEPGTTSIHHTEEGNNLCVVTSNYLCFGNDYRDSELD